MRDRGRSPGREARPGSREGSAAARQKESAPRQGSRARSSAAPVPSSRAQPEEAKARGEARKAGGAAERAESSGQGRKGKEEVEVVREPHSEYSENSDVEGSRAASDIRRTATTPPFETVVNLPTPKGHRLTEEEEETEKGPRSLMCSITQTFTNM